MTRARSKVRRWFERLLLVGGLCGLVIYAGFLVRKEMYQRWADQVFDRTIEQRGRTPAPEPVVPPDGLVGRLTIPRLRLNAIVREGSGSRTLDVALGHIPGTALPGAPGNVGVAGHRDTLFRGLREIRQGDSILFQTVLGDYRYEVNSTRIVKPDRVDVLNPGVTPELTLVTCYPFDFVGAAPDRFIVKARLEQSPQAAPVPPQVTAPIRIPKPKFRRVAFRIQERGSRQLAPGISIGLTRTDIDRRRLSGWLWLAGERRTIWLKNQAAHEPVTFYSQGSGKRRELVITQVSRKSVAGYMNIY